MVEAGVLWKWKMLSSAFFAANFFILASTSHGKSRGVSCLEGRGSNPDIMSWMAKKATCQPDEYCLKSAQATTDGILFTSRCHDTCTPTYDLCGVRGHESCTHCCDTDDCGLNFDFSPFLAGADVFISCEDAMTRGSHPDLLTPSIRNGVSEGMIGRVYSVIGRLYGVTYRVGVERTEPTPSGSERAMMVAAMTFVRGTWTSGTLLETIRRKFADSQLANEFDLEGNLHLYTVALFGQTVCQGEKKALSTGEVVAWPKVRVVQSDMTVSAPCHGEGESFNTRHIATRTCYRNGTWDADVNEHRCPGGRQHPRLSPNPTHGRRKKNVAKKDIDLDLLQTFFECVKTNIQYGRSKDMSAQSYGLFKTSHLLEDIVLTTKPLTSEVARPVLEFLSDLVELHPSGLHYQVDAMTPSDSFRRLLKLIAIRVSLNKGKFYFNGYKLGLLVQMVFHVDMETLAFVGYIHGYKGNIELRMIEDTAGLMDGFLKIVFVFGHEKSSGTSGAGGRNHSDRLSITVYNKPTFYHMTFKYGPSQVDEREHHYHAKDSNQVREPTGSVDAPLGSESTRSYNSAAAVNDPSDTNRLGGDPTDPTARTNPLHGGGSTRAPRAIYPDTFHYMVEKKINSWVVVTDNTGRATEGSTGYLHIEFRHLDKNSTSPKCCMLDQMTGRAWRSRGCSMIETKRDVTTCRCRPLGSFALIMDFYTPKRRIHPRRGGLLKFFVYFACGISSIPLLGTWAAYMAHLPDFVPYPRCNLMACISSALLLANITCLIAIQSGTTADETACTATAIILHFFLLKAMCWLTADAIHIFITKRCHWHIQFFTAKSALLAVGIPIAVIGLTIKDGIGNYDLVFPQICFLKSSPLLVAFIAPAVAMLGVCFSMYIPMLSKLVSSDYSNHIFVRLVPSLGVFFLAFLTYVFGFVAWATDDTFWYYNFAVTDAFLGNFTCILFYVFRPGGRVTAVQSEVTQVEVTGYQSSPSPTETSVLEFETSVVSES